MLWRDENGEDVAEGKSGPAKGRGGGVVSRMSGLEDWSEDPLGALLLLLLLLLWLLLLRRLRLFAFGLGVLWLFLCA